MAQACRGSQPAANPKSGSADTEVVTSAIPPFATREPERYQAIRIVTFNESSTEATPDRSSKVLVARDGEKRREEYFNAASVALVYLEIPTGRFVLLPTSGVYADLSAAANETGWREPVDETSGLSADLLVGEGYSGSTYEKLGTERLEGQMTTKYRVTSGRTNETAAKVETFIWIDESLGMPVRSETTSGAGKHSSKATMELKDIKLEVDPRLFTLPTNYRKVEARLIMDSIRRGEKLATPSQGKK